MAKKQVTQGKTKLVPQRLYLVQCMCLDNFIVIQYVTRRLLLSIKILFESSRDGISLFYSFFVMVLVIRIHLHLRKIMFRSITTAEIVKGLN